MANQIGRGPAGPTCRWRRRDLGRLILAGGALARWGRATYGTPVPGGATAGGGLVATAAGPMRSVLVHTPGSSPPLDAPIADEPGRDGGAEIRGRIREHRELVGRLSRDATVLKFTDILDEALAACPPRILRR